MLLRGAELDENAFDFLSSISYWLTHHEPEKSVCYARPHSSKLEQWCSLRDRNTFVP